MCNRENLGEPVRRPYLPALRFGWLTGAYDRVLRLATPEEAFKAALIQQAAVRAGQRVLDFGCGTGTLTLMIALAEPAAEVIGVDVDDKALSIAIAKVEAVGRRIRLQRTEPGELPFPGSFFDRVLSSLVFHHLTREQKRVALRECFRILRPGGELHIADWGRAGHVGLRAGFLLTQVLDGFETTSDNVRGLLPLLVRETGFVDVTETLHFPTAFGSLRLLRARKAE